MKLILQLEEHTDCLIIWDHAESDSKLQDPLRDHDITEIQVFYQDQQKTAPKEESKQPSPPKPKPKNLSPFDDMFDGDSDDDMDLLEFDKTPPKKPNAAQNH